MTRFLLLLLLLAPGFARVALAATPAAFLEHSQVIAEGNQIHAYGVPTRNVDGKIRYFDVTITVPILGTGKPDGSSPTTSVVSPKVKASEFVPGAYTGEPEACTIVASPFSGRTEFDLNCVDSTPPHEIVLTITWYTGPIAGNPLEQQLKSAGLDTLPGNENYSWGRENFGGNFHNCFHSLNLISARQVGDTLTLSRYDENTGEFVCQYNFLRTAP